MSQEDTSRKEDVCSVCGQRGSTWGVIARIANVTIDGRVCESALGRECQEVFFKRVPLMLRKIGMSPEVKQPDQFIFADVKASQDLKSSRKLTRPGVPR